MRACPDVSALTEYLHGLAAPDATEAVRNHIDTCADCRSVLECVAVESSFVEGVPALPQDAEREGSQLDRYTLHELVGAGAMGAVYAASDSELRRVVALKLLWDTDGKNGARERLVREAQAMALLRHPNVVNVHDVGANAADGRLFLAMELVDGPDLASWLKSGSRSYRETLPLLLDAARGLWAAHQADICHRDFKPSNVLIASDGRARVSDFGLAFVVSERGRNERAGTPAYMAPEQAEAGFADARSDQYAFCVTAWQALCGARPPNAPTRRVPRHIRKALERGLSKDPQRRFASMAELIAVLEQKPSRRALWAALPASLLVLWGFTSAPRLLCLRGEGGIEGLAHGQAGARYAHSWNTALAETCSSSTARPARLFCLRQRRRELVEFFRHADPARELPSTLEDPSDCLAATSAPGEDTQSWEQLAQARGLASADQRAKALELAQAASSTALDPNARIEARVLLGELQAGSSDSANAEATLYGAIAEAHASSNDRAAAKAYLLLTNVLASQPSRAADAHHLAELARAQLIRIGGDAGLEAQLSELEGKLAASEKQWDAALRAYQRALELRLERYGPEHPWIAETRARLSELQSR